MTNDERTAEAAIYGIPVDALDVTGPSAVTINGVVASLAAAAAMVNLTKLRSPSKQLTYRADQGGVRINLYGPTVHPCPYCARWDSLRLSGRIVTPSSG
jgi:hypothetical protein